MNFEIEITKLKNLDPFQGKCTINWSEEGGGEVYRIWDMLFLFYIPQYGGEGSFEGSFHITNADSLIRLANSWS